MENNITKTRFKFKNFIVFIVLYFIMIGSKEVFTFLGQGDFVFGGVLALSVILSFSFVKHPAKYSKLYLVGCLFYLFLFIMSLKPLDFEYGFQKAFLGLFVPLALFGFICKKQWNEAELLRYFILSILIISSVAILYKSRFGIFTRSVSFGLLGPIPFGWVNGMALLAVALKREKKIFDFLLIAFFFLMVIWSGSKGPLVAFFIISIFFFNRILGNKFSTKLVVGLLLTVAFLFVKSYSEDIRAVRTIMKYIEDPEGYTEGAGQGSIGAREYYVNYSLDLFENNPFSGVGFGGWSNSPIVTHKYPHNIYVELLSEVGLIGVFLFCLLLFNIKFKSIFGYMGLFGMLCLSFSGDFSYFRYSLFLLLISTYLVKEHKTLEQININ